MRNGVVGALGALLLGTLPCAAAAETQHAPPTLTPLVAMAVNAACAGAERYTIGLTRGITDAEAGAAARFFAACQAATRHDVLAWKNQVASVALGAAELSRGILDHDPSALRQAVYATTALRSESAASDDAIRAWTIIPDEFDVRRREAVIRTDCVAATWVTDAAYINVAARAGKTWISEPREPALCPNGIRMAQRWSPSEGVDTGKSSGPADYPGSTTPGGLFPRPEPP